MEEFIKHMFYILHAFFLSSTPYAGSSDSWFFDPGTAGVVSLYFMAQ
jgi:hypothetical protein